MRRTCASSAADVCKSPAAKKRDKKTSLHILAGLTSGLGTDMNMKSLLIGLAGGIGGSASNFLYLGQQLTAQRGSEVSWLYFFGTLIFFGLGAAIALIFQETDAKKAFFLGIGLPALIAAAATAKEPLSGGKLSTQATGSVFLRRLEFVPSAFAQERKPGTSTPATTTRSQHPRQPSPEQPGTPAPSPSTSAPPTTCNRDMITLVPKQDFQAIGDAQLWFFDAKGEAVGTKPIEVQKGQPSISIEVPQKAEKFGVWSPQVTARLWDLPKTDCDLRLQLTPQRSYTNDILRGLGARSLKPYEMNIQLSPAVKR
jgi:hypothetical protein